MIPRRVLRLLVLAVLAGTGTASLPRAARADEPTHEEIVECLMGLDHLLDRAEEHLGALEWEAAIEVTVRLEARRDELAARTAQPWRLSLLDMRVERAALVRARSVLLLEGPEAALAELERAGLAEHRGRISGRSVFLGDVLQAAGREGEALEVWTRATRNAVCDEALDRLGDWHARRGEWQEALACWEGGAREIAHGCGLGVDLRRTIEEQRRTWRRALSLVESGRYGEALVVANPGVRGSESPLLAFRFRAAQGLGRLDEVLDEFEAELDAEESPAFARKLAALLHGLERARGSAAIDALSTEREPPRMRSLVLDQVALDWLHAHPAEALVAARERLLSGQEDLAVLAALTCATAPDALPRLRARIETCADPEALAGLLHLLCALPGTEAAALFRSYCTGEREPHRAAARSRANADPMSFLAGDPLLCPVRSVFLR